MVWAVILGMAVLVMLPLLNVPAVRIGDHALTKHATQAENAQWMHDNGACTYVYRNVRTNRIVRLVIGDPLMAYGIVQSLSGAPVTAFYAPRLYWSVRLAGDGWEYMGREGFCDD
jgi:hypothetical protein